MAEHQALPNCRPSPGAIQAAVLAGQTCVCGAVFDQAALYGLDGRLYCSPQCRQRAGAAAIKPCSKEVAPMQMAQEWTRTNTCPQGHELEWLLPDVAYCACALGACPYLWIAEAPRPGGRPSPTLRPRFGSELVRLAARVRGLESEIAALRGGSRGGQRKG